jgi:hypothetical protein
MDLDPQNLDDLKMFLSKMGMAGERYALTEVTYTGSRM